MYKRFGAAVAAISVMAATEAAAGDWQPAAMGDEVVVGVDVDSIEVDGDLRIAPLIFVVGPDRVDEETGSGYSVATFAFDCVSHLVAILDVSAYRADGTHIFTTEETDPPSRIPARSLLDAAEEMVCQDLRAPADLPRAIDFADAARTLLERGAAR